MSLFGATEAQYRKPVCTGWPPGMRGVSTHARHSVFGGIGMYRISGICGAGEFTNSIVQK